MSKRGTQTILLMTVFFTVVFGPILLFAWKDWREILLLGVQRSPDLVEYVWNALGATGTPTLPSTSIPRIASPTSPFLDLVALVNRTPPVISYTASSTPTLFLSATSDRRERPSFTPTPVPTRTRTRIPTRTPTRIWTRTPTRIPSRTPTLVPPSPTPQPTDTEVPTNTPRPPTPTPRPTRTPRPTLTPAPTQVPTNPPPPPTKVPTHPPTTYP